MADIPLYPVDGGPRPSGLPGARMSGVGGDQLGGAGDRQRIALAGAAQDFAQEQVALQNQVRVNDALNQVRQKAQDLTYGDQGYAGLTGRAALDRPDGAALPDEYGAKLNQSISDIGGTLTDQQRRVFMMQAEGLGTSFRGDVQRHWLQQSRSYALSVQDSTQKLAEDQAAQKWDDPDAINGDGGLVQQAKASVYASGRITGSDVSAAMFQAGSAIHAKVIKAALENDNPIYASSYLAAHSKEMSSDDILAVQARVNQTAHAQMATLATDAAAKDFRPAMAPTDMDRLTGLVVQQESGGRETNPDGSTLTSRAGAKGIMQVLDSTAGNPGFGIQPAKKQADGSFDPADRARVGREYLGAMLRKYGSVPQALAAYNAGPDAVDKAIADAKSVDEPYLWLQALPKETQNYVASISSRYESGGGAPAVPTKEEFVQNALDRLGPKAPLQAQQLTRQQAEQRYALIQSSRKEQGDQALQRAQQELIGNGGDFPRLQREHPDVVADLARWDPGQYDNAMKFADSISRGPKDSDPALYARLAADPSQLRNMTDAQFTQLRAQGLNQEDWKHFATIRGDYLTGKTNNSIESVDMPALTAAIKERFLNVADIAPPKATDTDGQKRLGTVTKYLTDTVLARQQQLGKKLSPEEVGQVVDAEFRRGEVKSRWFGLLSPKFTPSLVQGYSDVPAADRAQIDQRMPGAPEADKLRVYWTWKGQANGG